MKKTLVFTLFLVSLISAARLLGQSVLANFYFENTEVVSVDNLIGTPTFSVIGTLTTASYFTGATPDDCPAAAGFSRSYAGWNTDDAYRFTYNTTGFNDLEFSFCTRTSNVNVGSFDVRVSTDGATWTTIVPSYIPTTTFASKSGLLGAAFDNQPQVFVEVHKIDNAGATTSNLRIDNAKLVSITLPIELSSLNVRNEENRVAISWQTASENNVQHFLIERSAANENWLEIGQKAAFGNSQTLKSYFFNDENPQPKAWYRLRSVDFDGREELSKVIFLERETGGNSMQIFPNPAEGEAIILLNSDLETEVELTIFDVVGKAVSTQKWNLTKGENHLPLDLSGLPEGIYRVSATGFLPVQLVKN